ncbi:MAG: hypothetical protein ABIF40_02725 [archaeon]
MIFNRTLTKEQILAIYNNETNKIVSQETSDGETWTVQVYPNDGTGDGDAKNSTIEILDSQSPGIDLELPVNQANVSTSTVNFNWTVTEDNSSFATCNFTLDGIVNKSTFMVNTSETTNYSVENLGEGGHLWNVSCYDANSNLNTSLTFNFTLDYTNPGIILDSPIELYNSSSQTIDFNFTVTDNIATYGTCDIYIDGAQNISEQSVLGGQTYNITVAALSEGTHYWNISCRDDANNTNMSIARNFTVDASLPVPWLNAPANNLNISTSTIRFNWTVTDNLDATLGCDLVVDGVVNVSNISSTNNVLQNQDVAGFGEGAHLWNVTCRDSVNNLNTSTTYNLTVDLTVPNVTLNSPINYYNTTSKTVNFNFTVTDNIASYSTCDIYIDGDKNISELSVISGPSFNISVENLAEGTHYWNISCRDDANNTNMSISRNFTVDSEIPVVSLLSPTNSTKISLNHIVNFTYTVNDTSAVANCSLYINGELNFTSETISKDTPQNISVYLNNDTYAWSINCTDELNQMNYSTIWNITVNIDDTAPVVSLGSPVENYNSSISNVTFYCNATNDELSNITLWTNVTGSWAANLTQELSGPSNSSVFNLTNISDGIYIWNCYVEDNHSNNAFASTNKTFRVDTSLPVPWLNAPANNLNISTSTIRFNWTVTDNLDSSLGCDLVVDGVVNVSNISSTNNTLQNQDVAGFGEGEHLWNVTCRDSANNLNTSETYNLTVDLTNPGITLDSPIDLYNSSSQTINFNFTVTDNIATFTTCDVYVDGVQNISEQSVLAGQTYNISVENIAQGTHYWNISCRDDANNTNMSIARNFTVDVSLPVPWLNAPANNLNVSTSTIRFNWTVTDNLDASLGCDLVVDGVVNVSNISSTNNVLQNQDVAGFGEGAHLWNVTCRDSVNNLNTSETYNLTVDLTVPNVTLNSPINYYNTTSKTVNFNFTVTDNIASYSTCDIYIDGDKNISELSVISGPTFNISVENLAEGTHYWNISCRDDANNTNMSISRNFTVDSEVPLIILLSPANASSTSSFNINFTYSVNDTSAITNCSLYINGELNITDETITKNTVLNFSVYLNTDEYSWSVNCTDELNQINYSTSWNVSLSVDSTPPEVSLGSPIDNYNSSINNVTIYCNATDNVQLSNITLWTNVTGSWAANLTQELSGPSNSSVFNLTNISDGIYVWNCYAYDNGTNAAFASANKTFRVDTSLPVPWLNAPAHNLNISTSTIRFNWTVTDNLDSSLGCDLVVDGVINVSNISSTNNTLQNQDVAGFGEGEHLWNVTCRDSANNLNTSETYNLTVDLTNPAITLDYPTNWVNYTTQTINFNFTVTDNIATFTTCDVYVDGAQNISEQSVLTGQTYNFSIENLAEGTHYWNISCRDDANNTNMSIAYNFSIDVTLPVPTLDAPENTTYFNIQTVNFNWTVTDNLATTLGCDLYIDSFVNTSNISSTSGETNNLSIERVPQGMHNWSIYCRDDGNNLNNSSLQFFTVDASSPSITLVTPADGNTSSIADVTFNWTVTDNLADPVYCNLTIDNVINVSNASVISSLTNAQLITNLIETTHYWNVTCWDYAKNSVDSDTYNFTISTTTPALNFTINMSFVYSNNIADPITLNVSTSVSAYCEYKKDALTFTSFNLTNAVTHESTLLGLGIGDHSYTIRCNDSSNNDAEIETGFYVTNARAAINMSQTDYNFTTNVSQFVSPFENFHVDIMEKENVSGGVLFSEYDADPMISLAAEPEGKIARFTTISSTYNIRQNISVWKVYVNYTDTEAGLLNVDESTLRLYYYNTSQSKYVLVDPSGVNIQDNYVWGNVTHNSLFLAGGPIATPPVAEVTGAAAGGGGGGIPRVEEVVSDRLYLNPTSIKYKLVPGERTTDIIQVSSNISEKQTVAVSVENIEDQVFIETNKFDLASKETKDFEIIIDALENTGVYTGKLKFVSSDTQAILNIIIEVEAAGELLDASIDMMDQEIYIGEDLQAQMSLINLLKGMALDATIYFTIKDYEGNIIYSGSDLMSILGQDSFTKTFDLPEDIKSGDYVLALEAVSGNMVAIDSMAFTVKELSTEQERTKNKSIFLIILSLAQLLLIFGLYVMFFKKKKGKKRFNP